MVYQKRKAGRIKWNYQRASFEENHENFINLERSSQGESVAKRKIDESFGKFSIVKGRRGVGNNSFNLIIRNKLEC